MGEGRGSLYPNGGLWPLGFRSAGGVIWRKLPHNALDSATLRPQPLGKRRAFSTAAPASMTTNDALRLNSKGGAEARPPTAQRGHFINTGSLSALNTNCPLSLGMGVPFRRYPQCVRKTSKKYQSHPNMCGRFGAVVPATLPPGRPSPPLREAIGRVRNPPLGLRAGLNAMLTWDRTEGTFYRILAIFLF